MGGNGVATPRRFLEGGLHGQRHATNGEEGRLDAMPVERVEDVLGKLVVWTVVEGQHDFAWAQQSGFRILQAPNLLSAGRFDGDRSGKASRLGVVGAIAGVRCRNVSNQKGRRR
jgi:hypothetical protein